MAEGDVPGLQWERTRLAWMRTLAAAATLEAAVVVALIHAQSRHLLFLTTPTLVIASVAVLVAQRDLISTHTPWHPTAHRTLESLFIAMLALAGAGLLVALA